MAMKPENPVSMLEYIAWFEAQLNQASHTEPPCQKNFENLLLVDLESPSSLSIST